MLAWQYDIRQQLLLEHRYDIHTQIYTDDQGAGFREREMGVRERGMRIRESGE